MVPHALHLVSYFTDMSVTIEQTEEICERACNAYRAMHGMATPKRIVMTRSEAEAAGILHAPVQQTPAGVAEQAANIIESTEQPSPLGKNVDSACHSGDPVATRSMELLANAAKIEAPKESPVTDGEIFDASNDQHLSMLRGIFKAQGLDLRYNEQREKATKIKELLMEKKKTIAEMEQFAHDYLHPAAVTLLELSKQIF